MIFHLPSFAYYLETELSSVPSVFEYTYFYISYILTRFPLRLDFLQEAVWRAVIRTYETPLETHQNTVGGSLFGGLLDAHRETLHDVLFRDASYIRSLKHERGGEIVQYETQIDIVRLQALLKESQVSSDVQLIAALFRAEPFVSIRLAAVKIFANTGQRLSERRINAALRKMEEKGLLSRNGSLRRRGRDVHI